MIFWRLQNNHVPRAKNTALFCFPLIVKRCAGGEVDYRSQIIHSNAPMGQSTLTHQGWTITFVFSSKRKIVLEWKHALLPFYLVIAIMTTLLTNKWSTRNSLLWQEISIIFLSVPQSLRARLHETRSQLKPVWNLKPIWNVVLFTRQFTWRFHCSNFPNNSKALLHMCKRYLLINVNLINAKKCSQW